MAITYSDILTWAKSKDSTHTPSLDTVGEFFGIPAYLEIATYGLCEDCGYGHVDPGEYASASEQWKLLLVHCLDDMKVRCMGCAAAHFGDKESAEGEPEQK
jgi:hypothetical protein